MKIHELIQAPTIRSVITGSGQIDRRRAERVEDLQGYFKKASSPLMPERKK